MIPYRLGGLLNESGSWLLRDGGKRERDGQRDREKTGAGGEWGREGGKDRQTDRDREEGRERDREEGGWRETDRDREERRERETERRGKEGDRQRQREGGRDLFVHQPHSFRVCTEYPIKKEKKESEFAQSSLTVCNPMDCSLAGSSIHPWDFPGKSTGVGCHFLLQEIFLAQELNLGLQHCRQMLLPSEPPGKSSNILYELINCAT